MLQHASVYSVTKVVKTRLWLMVSCCHAKVIARLAGMDVEPNLALTIKKEQENLYRQVGLINKQ